MIQLNVALMVFNLLPIPPLDGGGVAAALVPARLQGSWERFSRIAPFVLLALIILLGAPLGSILRGPMGFILGGLSRLAGAVANA